MKKNIKGIIDGPFYKGICNYKDSNVTLKIVAQCKEEDRFQVERDLMREYRRILLENNNSDKSFWNSLASFGYKRCKMY